MPQEPRGQRGDDGHSARGGYELTPRADEAEVLVVNTCSFIEPAQKESVDAILEMAEHKKFGAAKKLIVAGCLVERYRDADSGAGAGSGRGCGHRRDGAHPRSGAKAICDAAGGRAGVSVSRCDAAGDDHAAPCRVHQNCRRLRSSVHVLHHSAAARKIPQPAIRIGGARSGESGGSGGARNNADRAGHHFVRRRFGLRDGLAQLLARLAQVEDCRGCDFFTLIRIA